MNNLLTHISIIGVRAFPSDFVGTSGAEVYTEMVVRSFIKNYQDYHFSIYTKNNYPSRVQHEAAISILPIFTISSRTLETPIYSFFASCRTAFDDSSVIWYQSIGSAMFCWIPLMRRKRIVVTLHGLDWQRKKWSRAEQVIFSRIAYRILSLNVSLCGVSEAICRVIRKTTQKPITYVPAGFLTTPQQPNEARLNQWRLLPYTYLLYVGRLVPEKRIELLIAAWKKLRRIMPSLHLVIAGGHGNFPAYENRLKKQGGDPDIHWIGYVFGKDKATLFAHCTCFILPSELEGTPISILEALQYKIPCIVTNNILPKNLTHLHNVFVFRDSKKDSLEQCIRSVIKNRRKLHVKYSPEEKRILHSFSWQQTAHTYYRLFQRRDNNISG